MKERKGRDLEGYEIGGKGFGGEGFGGKIRKSLVKNTISLKAERFGGKTLVFLSFSFPLHTRYSSSLPLPFLSLPFVSFLSQFAIQTCVN